MGSGGEGVSNSTWNCRVIEFESPDGSIQRAIHEVFYEDGKLMGYSENPACVLWDPDEENESPRVQIDHLEDALERPVLYESEFGLASDEEVKT
jgi:hypothetical protein